MRWFSKLLMLLLCQAALTSSYAQAEPLTVLTTDFPPYSFMKNGELTGLSTEIVQAVLKKANIPAKDFNVFPWARAFTMAKTGTNILIFSIAKSPQRDELFQWVGPLVPFKVNLYKLRARTDIMLAEVEDAKIYRVGGEYKDIKQLYLKREGFVEGWNIELERIAELNIRKLFAGRIDLVPISETSLPHILKKEGFNIADVEKALALEEISNPLYMAFSLDVPEETVAQAARALQQLREEKVIKEIYDAYKR